MLVNCWLFICLENILHTVLKVNFCNENHSSKILAKEFCLFINASFILLAGNGNGVVRVVNKEVEQRTLIRGMRGLIQDLAFAHVSNPILACVDYTGSLFVYSIEATSSELICSRVLQVDADDPSPMSHRVIWCPYIPEEEVKDEDEVSKLLVLTQGSNAELWSVAAASRLFNAPIKAGI